MTDERYNVITVECRYCKAKQAIHVAVQHGMAQLSQIGHQTISCIACNKAFEVLATNTIIAGPFAAKVA